MPATFLALDPNNEIRDNVAAGSERVGFMYYGLPCSADAAARARWETLSLSPCTRE